jgi:Tfp pilus assembly pilus retraction ATPase PilT
MNSAVNIINVKRGATPTEAILAIDEVVRRIGSTPATLTLVSGSTSAGKSSLAQAVVRCLPVGLIKTFGFYDSPNESGEVAGFELPSNGDPIAKSILQNIKKAGANVVLIDELRTGSIAVQIIDLLIHGCSVMATIHSPSGEQAIERFGLLLADRLYEGYDEDDVRAWMKSHWAPLVASGAVSVLHIDRLVA